MRPNLTLNYGVRFSRFGSPYDENGHTTNFDPSAFNPANAPVVASDGNLCINDANGNPFDCDPGQSPNPNYNPLNGIVVGGSKQVTTNPVYFAPRIGIAWDPTGKGKTSIRTGYGVFIDSEAVNIVENNLFTNPPFITFNSFNSPAFDNPGASIGAVNNAPLAIGGLAKDWHQPYTQQWSLDIQHEFGYGLLLDVGYYGNKGTHLVNYVDINQPAPGAYATELAGNPNYDGLQLTADNSALINIIRPYQGYSAINVYMPTFSSNYHSLQTSLQKRFKGNNLISANYTWSKALSNLHFPAEYSVPQVTSDVQQDYGPTRYSRTHEFNLNFVYELPFFANQQGLAGHALGGWELSGIIQIESGAYLTPLTTSSNDPGGVGLQDNALPDQVGNPNSGAPHTASQWFNTAAFADVPCDPANSIPCQYRPGNARVASILGPGMQRWDLSLFKNIKFTERVGMQFRAEAFNIFNHTNFSGVDTTVGSSTYGTITGAHENRIMQLGLKLNF